MRSRVDLPTPLGPTTPIRSPGPTVSDTSSSTTRLPRSRRRPEADSTAEELGDEGTLLRMPAVAAPPGPKKPRLTADLSPLWRFPQFGLLWSGQLVNFAGSQLTVV